MSDISEQEPSNTIGELSKALSSELGKAERVSKHCSKIDTITTPAEKEERSVKNLPLVRLMERMISKLPFLIFLNKSKS